MRMGELTLEKYNLLREAWFQNSKNMADDDRPVDVLDYLLFQDGGTTWYEMPEHFTWLYVRNVTPGRSADFHALNLDGWNAVSDIRTYPFVLELMQDQGVHRLSMALPAPAVDVIEASKTLGFRVEGRMREAAVMNGRYVDALILGLVPEARKRRRKRKKNAKPRS